MRDFFFIIIISEASLLLPFPPYLTSTKQYQEDNSPPPPSASCTQGGEESQPLPCLRCASKEHSLPKLFVQARTVKIPQTPSQLTVLFQSSRAPRYETYQMLTGPNINGPQEEILFHFVPVKSETFNKPLIRENNVY